MKALLWRDCNDADNYILGFRGIDGEAIAAAMIYKDALYGLFGPDFHQWAREIGQTPMEFRLTAAVPSGAGS